MGERPAGAGGRPDAAVAVSWTGWRSTGSWRAIGSATAWPGTDPKLRLIDLQYHDVRRDKGLYYRLAATGKVERLVSDEEIERAVMEPPEDTRAYFRGRCIARYPDAIAAASWDSMIFDTGRKPCSGSPCASRCAARASTCDGLLERAARRGEPGRPPALLARRTPGPPGRMACPTGPEGGCERAAGAGAEEDPAKGGRRGRRRATPVRSQSASKAEELKEEMDEILDEIDSVLEENAEEFIKTYVQKGGE